MKTDEDQTKVVDLTEGKEKALVPSKKKKKAEKKAEKKARKKEKKKFSFLRLIGKLFLIFILLSIIAACVAVKLVYDAIGDDLELDKESLIIKYENSSIYDSNGNYLGTLSSGTKRKIISLADMGEYLPQAYVDIEDERFYEHIGVDFKRTAYATLTYITNKGSSSFGGSTITQQVVKNITQDKENKSFAGVLRKIKEISKAIQVEEELSKDQILELYLNLIFTAGNDINGVELGSIYYFDKSAKDLSLAEAAYMAGINNSPNAYKPFEDYGGDAEKKANMDEKIKTRTKVVLGKMYELGHITDEQYKQAVEEVNQGLAFKNGEGVKVTTEMSYVTEAALDQIVEQIMASNEGMSRNLAEINLYSSGYKIYTTEVPEIQDVVEEEIVKDKYITSTKYKEINKETGEEETITQYSAPTMVIMDHHTGRVVAAAAAIGSKEDRSAITRNGNFNYPTQLKKQTGSSMKPISVIAPGLETGTITGATVYDDCPTSWGSWSPKEWYSGWKGLMNMRTAIEVSANIPHAKALTDIGCEASVEFCKSVGLPDFTAEGYSLALGGLQDGVSPFQMCAAYAAIANNGEYITPTFYIKVTDKNDNIVYEPNQEKRRVMSEQNAYIEQNILTQTVVGGSGTAKYCAIKGMDVAAKTGTTNGDYDRWLSGFTPYYTASVWYGYDKKNAAVVYGNGNPAGRIWAAVMSTIHEPLESAKFTEPEGIVKKSVCRFCGLLASENSGSTYVELFTPESVPTERCPGHSVVAVCAESGFLSAGACPEVKEVTNSLPPHEQDTIWKSRHSVANAEQGYCPIHGGGAGPGGGGPTSYVTAVDQAGFQAATDAAAMGLTGEEAQNYINAAKEKVANGGVYTAVTH